MIVKNDKDIKNPFSITKVTVNATLHDLIAEVKTTMTFYNNHDDDLEGEFYYPLPEIATLTGYALDIEGQMVDGVVVEKNKGRQVFETIARRSIDPGLLEWTKGIKFKTRIFPMP